MIVNLINLYNKIGTIDEELDCLYPMYLLYPEIPRYELIQDEKYFVPLVKRHFIQTEDLLIGNLLLFKVFDSYHFGIYAGDGGFFHCCRHHKLRVSRLSGYKKFLIGVYKRID